MQCLDHFQVYTMWQDSSGVCKSGCQCNSVCVCKISEIIIIISTFLSFWEGFTLSYIDPWWSLHIIAYVQLQFLSNAITLSPSFTHFNPFHPFGHFHRPHESDSNEQCAQIRLCRFHSVSIWPSVEICWVCTASGNQSSTALRLCARLLSWSSDQNFALPRGHGKSPCFTRVIFSVQVWRSVALMFSLSIGW